MAATWPQIGQYLDFRDRDNIWNVGLVIARNESEIKVRSEGWAQKYDELLPISDDPTVIRNSRIQPFRSYIRGYTGLQKIPAIREHWKFTNDDHDMRLKKIDDFLAQLHNKTCEEITQFIRGQHYFYVDFLMTNTYQQTADMHRVYQYFRKHITLANTYITYMIQKRGMTWVQTNGGSGLDDLLKWEKTFAQCYYEIFEALYTIAGLFDRLSGFMKNNEKFIRMIVGVCETHENYIAEQYNSLKLVDSAKTLIAQVYQALCSDQPPKLVFPFVYSLFQLFLSIQKSITLQQDTSAIPLLLDQLFKIISIKFDQLSPEDLKHNEIDRQIEFMLNHIRSIYTKHNKRAKIVEWLQTTKIRISLILIRCDKLERKLRGINRLKDHCELSMRQQQNWSLTRERWKQLLTNGHYLQLLFLHNDHIQIFRKSIELTTTLYKFYIVSIDEIKYIWIHSVSKHPIIVKILQQFWIDISFCTSLTDIIRFINITTEDKDQQNQTNQQLEFEFQLTHALVKNVAVLKAKNTNNIKQFQNKVYDLMSHAYHRLTESLARQNIQSLIEIFSKSVLKYPDPHRLILQLYNSLINTDYFRITLYILNQIYFHSDHKTLFVPHDFIHIFLTCLQRQDINLQQVNLIMKLINEILLTSTSGQTNSPYCLKHEQFRQLWVYFMKKHDDYKQIFYQWIVSRKKQEYVECYNVINPVFPLELRHYIFDHVLSDPLLLNCQHITPKQLDLVIEFLLFKNLTEGKIQKRNYFTNYRTFYRLKATEVLGENLLWQIFGKSPTHDIVYTVNKYLLFFYFYYTNNLPAKVKRTRIGGLMQKMITNISQGQQQGNYTLIKHTLALLTKILDLIKQKKYDSKEHQSVNKIKITIARHTNIFQLQINYQDTIGAVINKIRDHFKLPSHRFKLISCKNDQLSFESRDIPMCCFTQRVFKVEDCTQEENIPAYILSFFTEEFEQQLLQMLEGKELTPDSYQILEKLELKLDKKIILTKINDILERHLTQHTTLVKELVYYYLLEVKIIGRLAEEQGDITPYLNGRQFRNILTVMNYRIETPIQINLCQRLVSFLVNLARNNIPIPSTLDLPAKCINLMAEIAIFILANHKNTYFREHLADIFHLSYQIIEYTVKNEELLHFFVTHPQFPPLLETVLINSQLTEIRHIFGEKLKNYLQVTTTDNQTIIHTQKTLATLLIQQIYHKIRRSIGSKEGNHRGVIQYYNILAKLIVKLNPIVFQEHILAHKQNQLSFFETVTKFLHALTQYKKMSNYLANILCGHYNVLIAIYESKPTLVNQQIVSFLLDGSLALSNTANNKPLCDQPQTITAAFDLLQEILVRNTSQDILRFIIQALLPTHNIQLWRTPADWAITRKIQPKQKYRGLINPGCICYMNSLLQQLYMIDDFRLHIMAVTHCKRNEDKQLQYYDKTHQEESYECEGDLAILLALKELFFNLYYAQQNTISPLTFTRTFRTSDRKPLIKINEQMDIDQFESILFDRLERGMSTLCQRNFIKDLFGGIYAHQILSKQCPHTSQREQQFISISLQVKKSIQQSFEALVKIEVLDGENKYYCEKCDRKVRAEKMQTLKKLPPYLILCLKRFEFNYQIDAKIKINDYCQFTQELKLKPYSQQHNNNNTPPNDDNQSKNSEGQLPDEYFNYKLRGVVVHTGSADSGHYYSFIEDKQGEWFEFNDEDVIPFDLTKLGEQAFGSRDNYEQCKIRNAYLLIYEKKAHPHPNPPEKQTEIMTREQNRIIIDSITQRNIEMHKFELLFLPQYEEFVQRMGLNVEQIRPTADLEREWYSFFLSFYLLVKFRKQYLHELVEFSKKTQKMIIHSTIFCNMFLQLFASCLFVEEFFIYNPNRDKCKIIASLLHTALLKYYDSLKNQPNYECDELLNNILNCFKIIFINYAPIYQLVATLRKFMEYLVKSGNSSLVVFIINKYTFEIVLFDHLFSSPTHKKIKEQYEYLLTHNQETVQSNYISPVKFEGKKFYPASASECWKLLAILFRLTNIILDREHLLMKDEKLYKQNTPNKSSSLFNYKDIFDNFRTEINTTPLNKQQLILHDSTTYRGAYAMYLVFRELRLPNRLIEIAEKGLGFYESSKYRPFMFVLSFFLNDSRTTPQEIQKIVICLERAFKANDRYFLQIDLINQWLSKFAQQSEAFAEALQQRRQFIDNILQWINKQSMPTPDLLKKHKVISNERLLHRYHGIIVSTEPKDYTMNSLRIKNQLESIMNLKYKSQRRKLNVQQNFTIGNLVEYFDLIAIKWRKGKIIDNNFGWLTILRQGKTETKLYLWEDSERIRMAQTKEEEPSESQNSDVSYSDSQKSMRSQSDIADR